MKRLVVLYGRGDAGSLGVIVTWSVGTAAAWLTWPWRLRWRHWYAVACSRHLVAFGPVLVEWAYKPRWVSDEQARRETTEAIARTIRETL